MISSTNFTSDTTAPPPTDPPSVFHSVFDPNRPPRTIQFKESSQSPSENIKSKIIKNGEKNENEIPRLEKNENSKTTQEMDEKNEKYIEMLIAQKRESFNYIKNWEFKRKQRAGVHLGVAEGILGFAMGVGANSIEGVNVIIKFLKEKKKQFERFGKEVKLPGLSKTGGVFEKNLEKLWECDTEQKEKFKNFAKFLEKEILAKELEENQARYTSKMETFKKLEAKLRQNLNKIFFLMQDKYSEYSSLFSVTLRLFIEQKEIINKDLFSIEQAFLYCTIEGHKGVLNFVKEVKNIWNELKKMELERNYLLDENLKKIIKKNSEMIEYANYQEFENQLKLIFSKNDEMIEVLNAQLFDVLSLLSNEQIQYIKLQEKIEDLKEEHIWHYLENFKMISLKKKPLVLAEYSVKEKNTILKTSLLFKEFIDIKLFITVDLNLVIIDYENINFNGPDRIIRLPLSTAVYKENELTILITELKSEYKIFNNLGKNLFKFQSKAEWEDAKEKISQYVRDVPINPT